MKVYVKNMDVEMALKNNGIEFQVRIPMIRFWVIAS
jgi:hypothetical protein